MTHLKKIQRAQALLTEAQQEAEAAGDRWTAEEVAWALAGCRNAEVMAEGFVAGLPTPIPRLGRAR